MHPYLGVHSRENFDEALGFLRWMASKINGDHLDAFLQSHLALLSSGHPYKDTHTLFMILALVPYLPLKRKRELILPVLNQLEKTHNSIVLKILIEISEILDPEQIDEIFRFFRPKINRQLSLEILEFLMSISHKLTDGQVSSVFDTLLTHQCLDNLSEAKDVLINTMLLDRLSTDQLKLLLNRNFSNSTLVSWVAEITLKMGKT